jgi:RNA polymerase sigma factor (sigma-70 family)
MAEDGMVEARKSDGELLAAWHARREAAAFEELYRRHGALVYSACLRRLGDPAEAEDAAAAVFMVLERKAGSLAGSCRSLAGWLQWCALNVARKAAWLRARRAEREKEAANMQMRMRSEDQPAWQAALPHLDAALAELPGAQRDVVVLQYMQGRSRSEVAAELAVPEGTVAKRAQLGLDKLRARLAREGAVLSGAALVAGLGTSVLTSGVPSGLATKISVLAGGGVLAGKASAIAEGTMKAMLWMKFKVAAAVLVGATVVAGGGGIAVKLAAGEPAKPEEPKVEKKLNPTLVNLPANTWVKLTPDRNPVGRSYSGICYGDGYLFYFGGGHGSHPGNDVELYDVAANKWIQATEAENWTDADKWTHLSDAEKKQAKGIGGGWGVPQLSPKGRPLTEHTYQMHCWFPEAKAFYSNLSPGLWSFDPEKKEWAKVGTAPRGADIYTWDLVYDPGLKTIVSIVQASDNRGVYVFDPKAKTWAKKCEPPTGRDWTYVHSAYDSQRKVHVVGSGKRWWTVDAATGVTKFIAGDIGGTFSMAYDPEAKATLVLQGKTSTLNVYDAGKDAWSKVELKGAAPAGTTDWNQMDYDPVNKCCLFLNVLNVGGGGVGGRTDGVFAFRLDPKGLEKVESGR